MMFRIMLHPQVIHTHQCGVTGRNLSIEDLFGIDSRQFILHRQIAITFSPQPFCPGCRSGKSTTSQWRTGMAGNKICTDIEEDPLKCYYRMRPSCSCEAIWDGIDRTCEAPTRK